MKNYIIRGLAALSVVLASTASYAVVTTEEDAELAARGWSTLNGEVFGSLGGVLEVRAEKDDQGKVLWYVVVMEKGAAVVAPDTEIEPVLAVLPGSDGVIPKGSTLDVMLRRDIANRLGYVQARAAQPLKQSAGTAAAPALSSEATKWNRLRMTSRLKFKLNPDGNPATIVKWLDGWNSRNKVGDVQTLRFWNQDKSSNYFTDSMVFNRDTPHQVVCGCVATAGAAIMHYFRAPSGNKVTRTCGYGESISTVQPISLTTKGGTYNWTVIDGLNLSYNNPIKLTDEALDVLATVASDCGIGCKMAYSPGASGSNTYNLQQSFLDVFNVKHVQLVTRNGGNYGGGAGADIGAETYPNIIYNQIRAGAPISLGIDGHEVVACGYGFDADQTDYTYVFLGWGSLNDAWYALPTIDTKATAGGGWYTSTFIDELLTEIAFDDKFIAVCGQLIDIDGNPIPGGQLTMGNGETVTADANGYWGTRVKPDDPPYVTDATGQRHDYVVGAAAKTTKVGGVKSTTLANALPDAMLIQLLEPSVEVYSGDTLVSQHGSLDRAIESAQMQANPRLVVITPSILQKPCEIGFGCTICAAGGDPSATPVVCNAGAGLTVAAGVRVLFSNVVFQATAPFLSVAAGGRAAFAGVAEIGTVTTADEGGVELAGALASYLTVDGPSAELGSTFGTYSCDLATAETSAAHFLNPLDEDLGGKVEGANLVWARVEVDPVLAVAYFTGDSGVTQQYYRKLHSLFEDHAGENGDVMILKDCELKAPVSVTSAMRLVCTNEEGSARITFATDTNATFYVEAGASLSVSNLVFTGATGEGAFVLNGGNLTLESGAEIADCLNEYDAYDYSGAGGVSVFEGRLTMKPGSAIHDCQSRFGSGGGVFVGIGCEFVMEGGSVTNCLSELSGGGVFVYSTATLEISGESTIFDNSSTLYKPDNLFVCDEETLSLTGELTGVVGLRCASEDNYGIDVPFGLVACDAQAASNSATFFRCDDAPDAWHGAVGEDGVTLVWSDEYVPVPTPPPEIVVARVAYDLEDGTTTVNEYGSLDEAFASLELVTTNATVVVCAGTEDALRYFSEPVEIAGPVVLTSEAAGDDLASLMIRRSVGAQINVVAGGELVVSNICVSGNEGGGGSAPLFAVAKGGELILERGAMLGGVLGAQSDLRNACAVSVYEGTLTMRDGAEILDCNNRFVSIEKSQMAPAGGVIVEGKGAVFNLEGGEIHDCAGVLGGGVFIGNEARMNVSGAPRIYDNHLLAGGTVTETNANLSVSNESTDGRTGQLYLTGEFTGTIGVLEPRLYLSYDVQPGVDTNVFGRVDRKAGDLMNLVSSAKLFYRDADSDVTGLVVTNADPAAEALLVWSSAVKDGVYTDENGNEYRVVEEPLPPPAPTEIDPPTAVTGLIYNGNEQTGVVEADGYTVTDNVAVNAGDYTATVTLKDGYVWTGGSTDPLQIGWSIAKATYDMSGVTFEGASFEADGSPKSIHISGDLPDGVSVSYEGNGQTAPGSYTVTAKFTGDDVNYEPIADKTATLTITPKQDPDPDPQWDVITNHPGPLAFKAIERVNDTEWTLVITNRTPYCNYRLIWTTDLTKGFTSTGAWEHAVGPAAAPTWTTNVLTTGGAWFWRAEGADGTNMVPHQAEGK